MKEVVRYLTKFLEFATESPFFEGLSTALNCVKEGTLKTILFREFLQK